MSAAVLLAHLCAAFGTAALVAPMFGWIVHRLAGAAQPGITPARRSWLQAFAVAVAAGGLIIIGNSILGVDRWRAQHGLAWTDLTPYRSLLNRLAREGSAGIDRPSLIRRWRSGLVEPAQARQTLDLLDRDAAADAEFRYECKRAAWTEEDLHTWLRTELPLCVLTKQSAGTSDATVLIASFPELDPREPASPPLEIAKVEARCVEATLDGESLRAERAIGSESDSDGGPGPHDVWQLSLPRSLSTETSRLRLTWELTVRRWPDGRALGLDLVSRDELKHVVVRTSCEADVTTHDGTISVGRWSPSR
jgi:hypothetical protein